MNNRPVTNLYCSFLILHSSLFIALLGRSILNPAKQQMDLGI